MRSAELHSAESQVPDMDVRCPHRQLACVLVTRSEEGMSLYTAKSAEHIPAVAREVFDVSGAGDTVIATLGVLIGAGADFSSAVRIANAAAGVVVGKLGTAVVTPGELD